MAGPRFDDIPGEEERPARSSAAPRFDDLQGEVEEAPGAGESFARGAGQGLSLGFGDELAGAAGAVGTAWGRAGRRLMDGQLLPDSLEAEVDAVGRGYRKARDEVRAENADAERSNGGAYLAGQVGGGAAAGIATGGLGHGLKGAVAIGAGEGAISGFGGSGADLTKADIKEYARAAGDALKGGAYGAAGGGVGYGIGQGVKAAGRWGKGVLDRARGALRGEAVLAREAEEKLAQEAAQEAEVRMGKAHAQGLEMNAKADRRKAQEAGREAMREAREKARLEKQAARDAEAPTQADPRIRAQEAAAREAEKAAGARTQVDQRLRAQDRENIQAARQAEKQARQEAQAAQRQAEALEKAQGQALQANKELDAARARRSAKEARQAQKDAEARAMKAQRQAEALEKQHGQGLEMNKGPRARGAARPAGAAPGSAEGPSPKPPSHRRNQVANPDEDPNTGILQGYQGQANAGMRAHRERLGQARKALENIKDPAQRAPDEQYLRDYGDAESAPADYLRRMVRQQMERRGYSPQVIERMMRERIGPQGNILPRARPAPVAPATEEAAENPALLRQRERGFGSQNMGAARMGQETVAMPNAHIRNAQAAGGDPFHDAPTKVGLVEVTPEDDFGGIVRKFDFRDPSTGRDIRITASVDPDEPHLLFVDNIRYADKPKAIKDDAAWAEDANVLGPRALRQVLPDLAKQFPGVTHIGGIRVTGISPGRKMSVPLPEVTQRMSIADKRSVLNRSGEEITQQMDASDLRAIAAKSESPALRRQREKGFGSQNMGAARFGEETIAFPNDDILRAQANRGGEATQVGPGPVTQAAAQREARGGEDLRRAFVRGAAGPDAAALGLGGIAVGGLAGGAGGVAAKGGAEVVKELAKNPAARARAISAFRLNRLAETRPEVYARVGGVLARAMERGPEHYAAKRHVLLLTDPELREAEAEADAELQGLSDEELAAQVARRR